MRHDHVRQSAGAGDPVFDPVFELPPRLGGRVERRAAGRAAAGWLALGGGQSLPPVSSLDQRADSEFAANSLLLDLRDTCAVRVVSAGAAVAAHFGLAAGTVLQGAPGSLAARLLDGCELLRLTATAVPVEGAFTGLHCACLLTRGVLMPLAGDNGRLGFAHAVVTWKEVLDATASAALHRELARARMSANLGDSGAKYRE